MPVLGLFTSIIASVTCRHATMTIGDYASMVCWTVQAFLQADNTRNVIASQDLSLLRPMACVFTFIISLSCTSKRWRVRTQKLRHFKKNKSRYFFEASSSSIDANSSMDSGCTTNTFSQSVEFSTERPPSGDVANNSIVQQQDTYSVEQDMSEPEEMDVDPVIEDECATDKLTKSPFSLNAIIEKIDSLSVSKTGRTLRPSGDNGANRELRNRDVLRKELFSFEDSPLQYS